MGFNPIFSLSNVKYVIEHKNLLIKLRRENKKMSPRRGGIAV